MCGGDGYDIFTCSYNDVDGCWEYFDEIGNAYDVLHCEFGCEEEIEGHAGCLDLKETLGEPIDNSDALLAYHFEEATGDYAYSSGTYNATLMKTDDCVFDSEARLISPNASSLHPVSEFRMVSRTLWYPADPIL